MLIGCRTLHLPLLRGLGELYNGTHAHHLGAIVVVAIVAGTASIGCLVATICGCRSRNITIAVAVAIAGIALVHVMLALAQRERHHIAIGHHDGVTLRRGAALRGFSARAQTDGSLDTAHNIRIGQGRSARRDEGN